MKLILALAAIVTAVHAAVVLIFKLTLALQ